jgi:2-furoyl-CoA dehydrogenase large subunit
MLEGAAKIILRQMFDRLGKKAAADDTVSRPPSWWRRLLIWLGILR